MNCVLMNVKKLTTADGLVHVGADDEAQLGAAPFLVQLSCCLP